LDWSYLTAELCNDFFWFLNKLNNLYSNTYQ
jgi:hypothetical protein